jgi:mannose-6-phosphate isomerase-like protein (cupin superfamily)
LEIQKINIKEKLALIDDFWHPRLAAELNGQHVRLAKLKGEFVAHKHDEEDEMFLVISGKLFIELESKTLELSPGEFVVIPRGVVHKPYSDEEVHLMLFEPASTVNTGDSQSNLKRTETERI